MIIVNAKQRRAGRRPALPPPNLNQFNNHPKTPLKKNNFPIKKITEFLNKKQKTYTLA
jgi:hypothetical protein